jgi:hypothetical protein
MFCRHPILQQVKYLALDVDAGTNTTKNSWNSILERGGPNLC